MAHRAAKLRQEGGPSNFGRRLSFDPSKFTHEKRVIELLNVRSPFRLDLSRPLFDQFCVIGAPLHTSITEDGQRVEPDVLYQFPEDLSLPDGLANFCMPSGVIVNAISRRDSASSINTQLYGFGSANGTGDQSFVFQLANESGPLYVAAVVVSEPIRDAPSFFPKSATRASDPEQRPLPPPPSLVGCSLVGARAYMFVSRFPYFKLHFAVLHNILQQERWYKINNIIQQDSQSQLAKLLSPEAPDSPGKSSSRPESSAGSDSDVGESPEEEVAKPVADSSPFGKLKAKWARMKQQRKEKKASKASPTKADDADPVVDEDRPSKSSARAEHERQARAGGDMTHASTSHTEDVTSGDRVSQIVNPGFELRGATPQTASPLAESGGGDESESDYRTPPTTLDEPEKYSTPPIIRTLRQSINEELAAHRTPDEPAPATATDQLAVDEGFRGSRDRFASAAGDSGLLWSTDGLPEGYLDKDEATPDASTDTAVTATEDFTETSLTEATMDDVSDVDDDIDADVELEQGVDFEPVDTGAPAAQPPPPAASDVVSPTSSLSVPVQPDGPRSRKTSHRPARVEFDLPPEQRDELKLLKRQSRDMFKRRPSVAVSPEALSTVITTLHNYRTLPPPGPGQAVKFDPMPDESRPQYIEYAVPKGRDEQTLLAGWGVAVTSKVLSRDHLIHLFNAVVVEKRVIIVCPHLGVLSSVGVAISSFLRPLKWEGIFVPILPQNMMPFLDAPVPFICGVQYLDDLPEDVMGNEDFVIVDVVNDRVAIPKKSLPALPEAKKLGNALKPVHKKFSSAIKQTIKKWSRRSKKKEYRTPYSIVSQQPQHMLDSDEQADVNVVLSVFRTYIMETLVPLDSLTPHTITDMDDPMHPVKMFMPDSFLAACDKSKKAFYTAFLETQLFSSYFEEQIGNPFKRRERSGRRR